MSMFSQNRIIFDEKKNQDILFGECDKKAFLIPKFSEWYNAEYSNYKVNDSVYEASYKTKFDSIYVFLGTWCEDSRREIPRFIKIVENLYFKDVKLRFFCIDGNKKCDIIDPEDYYVQFVPTIIFYYRGEELCRVIETPRTGSLEGDILDLLSRINF